MANERRDGTLYESIIKDLEEDFKRVGALWVHDDNPNRPHALLTSGKHSNGFFNGSKIIERPDLLERAVRVILPLYEIRYQGITRVVGSERGAVEISYEIARQLRTKTSTTQKTKEEMELKRFPLQKYDKILVCEDVMSTGGTTKKTIEAIVLSGDGLNIYWYPKILVLVNRSGKKVLQTPHGDFAICALLDIFMPAWEPEECPLCQKGSEAIKPKENWDKLTADLAV